MDSSSMGGHNMHNWRGEMNHGSGGGKDAYQAWDTGKDWERGNWEKGEWNKRERIPKKYLIWSQLQVAQDRVHNLYSEMTDLVELEVATITDAEFTDAPLRLMHSAFSAILLFSLGFVLLSLLFIFKLPLLAILGIYFAYWSVTLLFPVHVVQETRKWVSGPRRTGRYYKGIQNAWRTATGTNLMLMVMFWVFTAYDFSRLQQKFYNYSSVGHRYVNAIDIPYIQLGMLYSVYVMAVFFVVYFAVSYWFKRRAVVKQRQNILKLKKTVMPTGDVTHDMLRNNNNF